MARDYSGLQQLLREAANIVADDQRRIIFSREMFTSVIPNVGAGLTGVTRLRPNTIKKKEQLGYYAPTLPRYGSGQLEDSIKATKRDNKTWSIGPKQSGFVGMKAGVMQGTIENNRRPVPPRPFIGFSKRAVSKIDRIKNKYKTLLVRDISRDLSTDLLRSTNKIEVRFVVT